MKPTKKPTNPTMPLAPAAKLTKKQLKGGGGMRAMMLKKKLA